MDERRFKKGLLSPEDLAQAAEDATEAAVALALRGAEDGAQHASQVTGIDAAALLTLAEEGEEARGDGGHDLAHQARDHASLLRDAIQHIVEVAAKDVAQDLATVDEVGTLQVVDDVARVDGMVAEGLGQSFSAARRGGVLLHGTQQ